MYALVCIPKKACCTTTTRQHNKFPGMEPKRPSYGHPLWGVFSRRSRKRKLKMKFCGLGALGPKRGFSPHSGDIAVLEQQATYNSNLATETVLLGERPLPTRPGCCTDTGLLPGQTVRTKEPARASTSSQPNTANINSLNSLNSLNSQH